MKSVCDLLPSLNQAHPWLFFFSSRSHWLSDERVVLQKNWRTGSGDLNSISYSPLTSQVTLGQTANAELGLGQIMFSSHLIYWFPHWFPLLHVKRWEKTWRIQGTFCDLSVKCWNKQCQQLYVLTDGLVYRMNKQHQFFVTACHL